MLFNNICSATVSGNKRGLYIDPRNCQTFVNVTKAENYRYIDLKGVNSIHIYRHDNGKFFIAQAGGYTCERGLFCDLYDESGNVYDNSGKMIKEAAKK